MFRMGWPGDFPMSENKAQVNEAAKMTWGDRTRKTAGKNKIYNKIQEDLFT